MIGAKKIWHFMLLLLILAKSKVLTCQEYDGNLIEYDDEQQQQQQHHKKHPKHNHNHHHHHHHHRHRPKTYFHFDDVEETLRHFNLEKTDDSQSQYDNSIYDYQNDYKTDELLQMDQERWPKFEEIERLAGISEWKRERWKSVSNVVDVGSTAKPPNSRIQKFTYRRVQGSVNGSKRNAIIAVSAIAPKE